MTFTGEDHVTEREPGRWEDCTFASMLETMRLALPEGREIPATIEEVNRFRANAGYPDNHTGVTIEQTIPAAKARYHLTDADYTLTREWTPLALALADPTKVCVVTGSMNSVPDHLRRWDPSFRGNHAVANHGMLIWCDPLAPKGTYTGDLVTTATWKAFATSLSGWQAFIMTARGDEGMIAAGGITLTSNKLLRAITTAPALDAPGGKPVLSMKVGQKVPYMGNASAHRVGLFNTGIPYPDKVARPTYLYVANANVAVEDAPAPPLAGGGTDTGPAVQARWEQWTETHPK